MTPTEFGQNVLNLLLRKREEKIFTAELFVCLVISAFALVQIFFQSECTRNVRWALNCYCRDDWMWKAFSRPATLQWYTVVANSHQNAETIFVLTFGFTGFWSLFFDLAFQNETLYKVPSSRKSGGKKEEDHSYSSYLRTEKIWSRTVKLESWSQQQQYLLIEELSAKTA